MNMIKYCHPRMSKTSPWRWYLSGIQCISLIILSGCSPFIPQSLSKLDISIHQVIYVTPIKKSVHQAMLSAWQRQGQGWQRRFIVRAVIGRNGLASPDQKKEGDGKTPSGVFLLGPAFGYASSITTGLQYRQATQNDFWVDDVHSLQYNQWVVGLPVAKSFERMRRFDYLYSYGIVIGYNMHPIIPGAGSAIFMHVWRGVNSSTSGCVALNQRQLKRILRWLKQEYQPVIILEKTDA